MRTMGGAGPQCLEGWQLHRFITGSEKAGSYSTVQAATPIGNSRAAVADVPPYSQATQ